MRYFKMPKDKKPIPVDNDNVVVLYERAGFVETDAKGEPLSEKEEETTEE